MSVFASDWVWYCNYSECEAYGSGYDTSEDAYAAEVRHCEETHGW